MKSMPLEYEKKISFSLPFIIFFFFLLCVVVMLKLQFHTSLFHFVASTIFGCERELRRAFVFPSFE